MAEVRQEGGAVKFRLSLFSWFSLMMLIAFVAVLGAFQGGQLGGFLFGLGTSGFVAYCELVPAPKPRMIS